MTTRRQFIIGAAAIALTPSIVQSEPKTVTLRDYDLDDYVRAMMPTEQEWQKWAKGAPILADMMRRWKPLKREVWLK
jgi:hypothetical protein